MARTEVTGSQIKDASVDLSVDVTGVLPVANGGSGSNTIALNNVVLGNGSGAVQTVAPGTSGNVLTSNGTTWVSQIALARFMTGTIATASGTAAKTVTLDSPWASVTPAAGDWFLLTYTNGSTPGSITIAINGSTARPVRAPGGLGFQAQVQVGTGCQVLYYFDGTNLTQTGPTQNTTYAEITDAQIIGATDTNTGLISGRRAEALMANEATKTRTLTNKTLSGSNNTFSNIPVSAVTGAENTANKAVANGYASLDGAGKIPVTQLPSSVMEYQGTWNASTNSPTLADGTGNAGDVYRISTAGTRNLGSGSITYRVGDYVIYSGSIWQKSSTTDTVASVAGLSGDVTDTALKSALALDNVNNTDDANKNVLSATKLTTARTINNVSFDGSANITIPSGITRNVQVITNSGNLPAASNTDYTAIALNNGNIGGDVIFTFNGAMNATITNSGTNSSVTTMPLAGITRIDGQTSNAKWGQSALYCDGTNIISVNSTIFDNTTRYFTAEAWIRPGNVTDGLFHQVFGTQATNSGTWGIGYTNKQLNLTLRGATTQNANNVFPNTTTYVHIALVMNSSQIRVYANGTEVISVAKPTTGDWIITGSRSLSFGGRQGGVNTALGARVDQFVYALREVYVENFTPPGDPGTTNMTLTLPNPANSVNSSYVIRNNGSLPISVTGATKNPIGGHTIPLSSYVEYVNNGSVWYAVN